MGPSSPHAPRPRLRPIGPSEHVRSEPIRPSRRGFDPGEARRAWRQVARVRGSGGAIDLSRRPGSARFVWLGAAAILAVVAWWWRPDAASEGATTPGTPTTSGSRVVAAAAVPGTVAEDVGMAGVIDDSDAPIGPQRPGMLAVAEDDEPGPVGRSHRPAPARARTSKIPASRKAPAGTDPDRARAFERIPYVKGDGQPVGGLGTLGAHVDELDLGSTLAEGQCKGADQAFVPGRDVAVHACIRIVHRRMGQRIVVHWEQDGRLVRRNILEVPPRHAWRTRASLPVRRSFKGNWRVRVLDPDGTELASSSFTIE